jgi:hypothetical protein
VNLSLKPLLISTFTILLLALIVPVVAQDNGAVPFSQAPYRIGEHLTYNVSFSNFPSAAHAELEVVSRGMHFGRDAIQLRAHVETIDVVNVALYAINNDYTTYVDPQTGLPFRSQEVARDAIKSAADSYQDFTQPAGNEAIPPKQRAFPGTYDFLSAFYRARALPLANGASYNLNIRSDSATYQVEIRVVGREVVRTNVGSFSTIVTQVWVNDSQLRNMRVYFSDDEWRVPVLFTGRLSTGELRAELAGSEMIKPPETPSPTPAIAKPAPMPVASATPSVPAGKSDLPFPLDEQLNYQVFIGPGNTALAQATFQVRGRSRYFERDGIHLTVTAQTTAAAARLFVARDQIDSYIDPKALLPFRTVLNLHEGRRRLTQTLEVNQETGAVITNNGARIEIPVGTHDYLSFFYALRTFNLNPTKRSAIAMLVENKPKTIFVTAMKREAIDLAARKVPAIALSLTTDDPEPDKYQFRIWVSDDSRRLPLRITCTTQLGPLRADLAILPASPQ